MLTEQIRIKKIRILPIALICLALCGCAETDYGAGRYIEPYYFGGEEVVPKAAPSEALGEKRSRSTAFVDTAFTDSEAWEIRDGRFIHAEFKFEIPAKWRGRLAYAAQTVDMAGYPVRRFDFSFVDGEDQVKLMTVERMPRGYVDTGLYAKREVLGESADGEYVYYLIIHEAKPREGSPTAAELVETLRALMSDRFEVNIAV